MLSDKFRRQLRQETSQWLEEGLIDTSQYNQISQRYEFDALDVAARDRFVAIFIGLGSVLLGLGVITFVAANWQDIPRLVRVILLLTLFIGVNVGGYFLWRQPVAAFNGRQRWVHRLGEGLLLLGGLILGANLALMGQIFHQSGSPSGLFLIWAIGVALTAYGLQLRSLSVLSILLMGIGYWLGVRDSWTLNEAFGANYILQYMPLLSGVLFIPLAYWCRSRAVFVLGAIAVLTSLEMTILDLEQIVEEIPGILLTLAVVLPAALFWSYDDAFWNWLFRRPPAQMEFRFRPAAQSLAIVHLAIATYLLSFRGFWTPPQEFIPFTTQMTALFQSGLPILLNLNLPLVMLLTLGQWFFQISPRHERGRWGLTSRDGMVLVFLVVAKLVISWHWSIAPIWAPAVYLFNVLLFLLASALIREAIAQGERFRFWSGMLLLALQIFSRMLEYNTSLLFKSLVFALCGIGVIIIGLWFERYVRSFASPQTANLSASEEPS